MSKIIRLSVTNYKRLKAVEITPDPDGNLVMIAGRNAQGKSSVLDSITAALGGVDKKTTPKPIRDGETYAEIVLETEDLIVERRFLENGKSNLIVRRPDGSQFPAPQAKLDDLLGKLSLDPLAFTQLDNKKQLETLIGLVELPFDPAELAKQRQQVFDERADIGRQRKALGEAEFDDDMPTDEQSAGSLIEQISEAQNHNTRLEAAVSQQRKAQNQIKALEEQLEAAKAELESADAWLDSLGGYQDVQPLKDQLETVEQTNEAIRANNEARAKAAQRDALADKRKELTAQIEDLDKTKADGLAQAEMPVEGLSFDESGVIYNDQPLRQASSAEQLRVSLAMAIALNPELRVIRIADGSLLDDDNLALIRDMADEHDAQVWLEVVGDGDGTGLIIEDGEVADVA